MTKSAPKRAKGWYTLPDGSKHLSVTTIKANGIPLDLTGWAGWEAGWLAMESLPKLVRTRGYNERRKLAYWLGQAAERKKSEAGELGTAVHKLIEAEILGQPAAKPTEEQQPFVDAFHRFMDLEQPEFEAIELVVANPADGWAGTVDAYLTLPNIGPALTCGDWKTSAKIHSEFALQLAAYQRATIGWLKDGTEIVPPKTESAVVIHIRPDAKGYEDTGYRIVPLDTSDAVYECFLNARRTALEWVYGLEKTVVGEAYVPGQPVLEAEVVEEMKS